MTSTILRIEKTYRHGPLAGVVAEDTVTIEGGSKECAAFVNGVNSSRIMDYDITDYEVALITGTEHGEQIVKNPTGGREKGKLILP